MTTIEAVFNTADPSAPGHYDASKTALLLLDFHSMFVEHVAGPKGVAASQTAAKTMDWARSQGIHVIHCLIDVEGTPFSTCKDTERFAGVIGALKSNGAEEPAELLKGSEGDARFTRRPGHISALKSPGLDEFLKEKGIKSLVLTGLSTSGCVMRTALAATDAEHVVTVLSDGCADQDQTSHDTIVGKLLPFRGYVLSADEFKEGFEKVRAAK